MRQCTCETGEKAHLYTQKNARANLQLCKVRAAAQSVFLRKQQVATEVPGVIPTLIF